MKKITFAIVACSLVAGLAFANSISVPFFGDSSTDNGATGQVAFIGIKNVSDEDKTIILYYFDFNGGARTPANNTFLLEAGKSVSWRAGAVNATSEGTSSRVPDMTQTGLKIGSAQIFFTGDPTDITGRVAQTQVTANGRDASAYGINLGSAKPGL